MAKRSCRRTQAEKEVHEFAVKVRKMTDQQLYDFVCEIESRGNSVEQLIQDLASGKIAGIGPSTVNKIRQYVEFGVEG